MFMREYTSRTSWGGVLEYERTIRLEQVMEAISLSRTQAAGKALLQM